MKKKAIKNKTKERKVAKSGSKVKKKTVKTPIERPVKRIVKKDNPPTLVLKKNLSPMAIKELTEQFSCLISELGCTSIISILNREEKSCSYVSTMNRRVASEVLSIGSTIEHDRETDNKESHAIALRFDINSMEKNNDLDWGEYIEDSGDCEDKDEVWIEKKEAEAILKEKTNG